MKKYLIFGIITCALFFAAGTRGFVISGLLHAANWGPVGKSQYHK
jgi:hypothetical protein